MRRRSAVLAGLLILAGLVAAGLLARDLYRPYRGYSGNLVVLVELRTPAPAVADLLVKRGVLAHPYPFLIRYGLGRLRHRTFKAGEYLFDRPLRPIDVYRKLVAGDVYLHSVVIPEGSDRFDMARIYQGALNIDPDAFMRATTDVSLIRGLDPQAPTLEGYLFPDTYRFPRGASAARVVETMVARFRRVMDSQFAQNLRQRNQSLHDLVTLASLVEKETPDPSERPVVAEVFERRLEKKMLLACDPTVIYAQRLNHPRLERPLPPITASDLKFDSPYNTYRHPGLPPGPIASPGEASLRAALHPASENYLYFVSNNQGGHNFARTLAEHERNVARYRREVAELRRGIADQKNSSGKSAPKNGRDEHHVRRRPANRAQRQK